MDKNNITIMTGTGGILGTGHFQRMLNLAAHLNRRSNFNACLFLQQNEFPVEKNFSKIITYTIPADTNLIIRDMRDSSPEEIMRLKKIAPVLSIDDSGPGREYADFTLNLLPVPSGIVKNTEPEISLFLYGHNFTEGISGLINRHSIEKNIDVAIYAGFNPEPELISQIRKSIPDNASSVLLANGKAVSLSGDSLPHELTYAGTVSGTKIMITHFGLTMFEAHACGCAIAALNPTEYHNSLTDMVKHEFNVIHSSAYDTFSPETLKCTIEKELMNKSGNKISAADILKKIEWCTENFINYLATLHLNNLRNMR